MTDTAEFITTRTGHYSQFPPKLDPAQSHQCIALFNDYTQTVNTGETYPGGNGADIWAHQWLSYDHIPATNTPMVGDWASWSGTSGAYPNGGAGHAAMWTAPNDARSGYFFTQNPGTASTMILQYAGIQGYLRMKEPVMTLNVIDVSRYQAGQNIGGTGADAVIVGITYGSMGVNPYAGDEIARARAAGMLVGLYHIRAGDGPTPAAEAQHFLNNAAPYLDGKTVMFLDWEECTLSDVPWAVAWCTYIKAHTNVTPVIYMSASATLAYNWAPLRALNVGLWVAQYPYNTVTGFVGVNWTPPATSWPFIMGWQYAGTGGSVGGLNNIDLSVFYITKAQWIAYATPGVILKPETKPIPITEDTLTAADIAAINAHTDTAMKSVIAYVQTIMTNQWRVDGVHTHQGVALVAEANQTALRAIATKLGTLPADVLNQTFTTAAGATTNVPGILDAIHSKPDISLTADQAVAVATQIAAVLQSALPSSTIQALAAQLTK